MRLEGLPMKNVTKIISPAKVNLVLAVGEKQESGFHEVQTIMHSLAQRLWAARRMKPSK